MSYYKIASELVEHSFKMAALNREAAELESRRSKLAASYQSCKERLSKTVGSNISLRVFDVDGTAVVVDCRGRESAIVTIKAMEPRE